MGHVTWEAAWDASVPGASRGYDAPEMQINPTTTPGQLSAAALDPVTLVHTSQTVWSHDAISTWLWLRPAP